MAPSLPRVTHFAPAIKPCGVALRNRLGRHVGALSHAKAAHDTWRIGVLNPLLSSASSQRVAKPVVAAALIEAGNAAVGPLCVTPISLIINIVGSGNVWRGNGEWSIGVARL